MLFCSLPLSLDHAHTEVSFSLTGICLHMHARFFLICTLQARANAGMRSWNLQPNAIRCNNRMKLITKMGGIKLPN